MRSGYDICNPLALSLVVALFAPASAASQPRATQDVCVGEPTGRDVFSVGELRTSILAQMPFQEMNGAEWALADGRPLLVQTALSPHLSEEEFGLTFQIFCGASCVMRHNGAATSASRPSYRGASKSDDPAGRFWEHTRPMRFTAMDTATMLTRMVTSMAPRMVLRFPPFKQLIFSMTA